jgi:hypothetical protein
VQHGTPALGLLVRREDHRALLDVPLVDDVEEHVRSVVAVGEVTDLVHDQDVRPQVAHQRVSQLASSARAREVVDELRAVDEERLEAVLHGAVCDGDGEVRLAAPRLALEDHRVPLGDEVGREQRAEGREAERRLVGEVELLDGSQEGKLR